MNIWEKVKYWSHRLGLFFKHLFRTRAYLHHRFLNYMDTMTFLHGKPTEADIMFIIDLELEVKPYIGQEIMDEMLILGLIQKDEDGVFSLTEAGRKRLSHRYFIKENNKILKEAFTTYTILTANLALGIAAIIQATQDHSSQAVNELKNIKQELHNIDSTIQKENSVIKRDTVFLILDTAKHK